MPPRFPRRWQISPYDPAQAAALRDGLGLQPLSAAILASRGFTDVDSAHAFLNPSFEHLSDPLLMRDMDRAVRRALLAFRHDERVLVFGDYDVDGVTATSCVYLFLRELGFDVHYEIPTRSTEGYGLTVEKVKAAHAQGVKLLITTDCGISAHQEIEHANTLGIDTIVIDHHSVPPQLPNAKAILNPLQPGCRFPYKRLAAVGVSFNFVRALHATLRAYGAFPNRDPDMQAYLDVAALGTVADAVPLTGDNRVLVSLGLEVLRRRRRPGVSALMERAQIDDRPITAKTIGYRLAPLLNAAGRMGHAGRCVELLTTDSYHLADKLARDLERDNNQRQKYERQILAEAVVLAEKEYQAGRKLLMLGAPGWHEGVLGIVASRIKEMYHSPAALVAVNEETGRARVSLRSIEGIDLVAAMRTIEPLLESYGGHTAAAGMSLRLHNLEPVREALDAAIGQQIAGQMPTPILLADAVCTLHDLNDAFLDELRKMGPFGSGNQEPTILLHKIRASRRKVVGNKHLRVQLRDAESSVEAIGFALAELEGTGEGEVDVAVIPRYNLYQGQPRLELQLRDMRAAHGESEAGEVEWPPPGFWEAPDAP
jgi:single-stranded-DNA-specific exonuclease